MLLKSYCRLLCLSMAFASISTAAVAFDAKDRPAELISQMKDSPLKSKLQSCVGNPLVKSSFSIGHRGAALGYPEHTKASYIAAAMMGAGIVECDVTFTKDKELVCRHSQNDLHYTTNIVATELGQKCTKPFTPAQDGEKADAECKTTDLTLAEFKSLKGKMEGADKKATSVAAYLDGMPKWRQNLGAADGEEVLSHVESIALFKSLDVQFTPELKEPTVEMPFDGFSRVAYAQKMIDEYKTAGIDPARVWPQSFHLEDVLYWIEAEPEFGKQAVYLDARYRSGIDPNDPATFTPTMKELKALGVNYLAPPLWMLVTTKGDEIVPSAYAIEAKAAGLELITWTLERSGPLQKGGGWYYKSITPLVSQEGDTYMLLNVLHKEIGIKGIFSDWPATATFYANCFGLK